MTRMQISWIMPVFNAGAFLDEAVESILAAQAPGLSHEILLVDDCSTDADTRERLERWSAHPSVRLLRQARNGGPARARNAGMRAATGDWLAFLDADDVAAPGSIETRVALLRKHAEIRWLAGDMLETREPGVHSQLNHFRGAVRDGAPVGVDLYRVGDTTRTLAGWPMLPFLGSMMIRRDLAEEAGYIKEDLVYGEDIHFCLVLSCHADLYWLDRPVLYLRRHHESMTKNLVRAARAAPQASLACLRDPRLKAIRREMRWHYAANLRQSSGVFLRHGLRLDAVRFAGRSLVWSPNDPRSLKALVRSLFGRGTGATS